jgi:hypothetical protein
MADILSRGFDEAVKIHCAINTPKESKATELINPECQAIGPLYKEHYEKWDTAPNSITVSRYIRNFETICEHAKARYLSDLTEDNIDDFRDEYLQKATEARTEVRGREAGDRRQETGDRRQETGDRRQETGDRRQEAVIRGQ